MDVATLVAKLLPLLAEPAKNSDAILELLGNGRKLADYEVVRFLVAKRTEPFVRGLLSSPDPYVRRSAVRWVELTFARSPAAQVLRGATKDRSKVVRNAATRATRSLRLDDVALPNSVVTRTLPAGRIDRIAVYNPTGWRFGLDRYWARAERSVPALAALETRSDVEKLLGLSTKELKLLLRPGAGPGCSYVVFEIPKARGGTRELFAPRGALKQAQRRLLTSLLAPLPAHPAAHGFVPGRSIVTNAAPHVGARVIVKMDLVDFFPTIHFGRLIGLFRHYGMGEEAARTVAALVTYRPKLPDGRVAWPSVLPQGAPTSPALSNLVCRRLDARLSALASRVGAAYTRYADDLTFSFQEDPEQESGILLGHFFWWVNQILGQEGFAENLQKRRVLRRARQQRVTGVVTNSGLSVPREARRRFRAILHACELHGVSPETTGHEEPALYLLGFAGYVAMVQPEAGRRLLEQVKALLANGGAD